MLDASRLAEAIKSGDLRVVREEVEGSSDALAVLKKYPTLVHIAASRRHVAVAAYLIDQGLPLDGRDEEGGTPLIAAIVSGQSDAVNMLLKKGADFKVTARRMTPLKFAAIDGHTRIVELLLDAGASHKSEDNGYLSPLHLAATRGHLDTVKLLVSRGALVTRFDIQLSEEAGNREAARFLRTAGR